MNDDHDADPQADDRPAHVPATRPPVVLLRAHPSTSGRVFRWWLAISLLLAIALGVCVAIGLQQVDLAPVHIAFDSGDIGHVTVHGLNDDDRALVGAGALLLGLLVLLLIPLFLVLVLCMVAIAVVCAVAVPLAAVALALAAVTSPLWLIGLLVWLAARRRPAPSATMAA